MIKLVVGAGEVLAFLLIVVGCLYLVYGDGALAQLRHVGRRGGRLRLIATLHDPAVIRKILAHLGRSQSGQSPGPAPPERLAAAP